MTGIFLRYDPVHSDLTVELNGVRLRMIGSEAAMFIAAMDHAAAYPEQWSRTREESARIIEQFNKNISRT